MAGIAIVKHNQIKKSEPYFGHSSYRCSQKILPMRYCMNIAIYILYLKALSDIIKCDEVINIFILFFRTFYSVQIETLIENYQLLSFLLYLILSEYIKV